MPRKRGQAGGRSSARSAPGRDLVPGLSQVSCLAPTDLDTWSGSRPGEQKSQATPGTQTLLLPLPSLQRRQGIGVLCHRCQDRCPGKVASGVLSKEGKLRGPVGGGVHSASATGLLRGPSSLLSVPVEDVGGVPHASGNSLGGVSALF